MAARLGIEPARASIDRHKNGKSSLRKHVKRATPKNPDRETHARKTEGQEGLVSGFLPPGAARIAPLSETSESSLYLT